MENRFKKRLKAGEVQLGIWNSLPGSYTTELLASAGYDWVLIDTEHAPTDVLDTLPAMQAIAGYPEVSAIVRPAVNDTVLLKRYLDLGVQTVLIPYVQSVEEAKAAVAAMRYPPNGIRGVAGSTRASRFGQIPGYFQKIENELCLLVQVETRGAMEQLEDIASVDGVDGVFFGPSDLAASYGFIGQPSHPEVKQIIEDAILRLKKIGVPSGILTTDEAFNARCIELGTTFNALGIDASLLMNATRELHARF